MLHPSFTPLYSSGVLSLDESREFNPNNDAEFFAALPAQPGVFLLEMADAHAESYLAQTADIRRAAERLLHAPDAASKRLNLRNVTARVRYRATASRFERSLCLYRQSRLLFPQRYRARLRLRPPALLKVNLRNGYPRCYVTRSIRADSGFYFGPFPSRRAADAFNEGVLDLFKIRRCQIKIRRDPAFPGCVYSDIKKCMAPCFAGCTKQEYDADVAGLVTLLATRGPALLDPLQAEREKASEELDFERAADLHRRVEKIKSALHGLPDVARRLDGLDAVILQRGAGEKAVFVFPIFGGILAEPLLLNFAEISGEPRSVEAMLRQTLQPNLQPKPDTAIPAAGAAEAESAKAQAGGSQGIPSIQESYGLHQAPAELGENLSLVARWFYSKPREGEVLFRSGEWPYRRILRACARLLAPAPPASGPEAIRPGSSKQEESGREQDGSEPRE